MRQSILLCYYVPKSGEQLLCCSVSSRESHCCTRQWAGTGFWGEADWAQSYFLHLRVDLNGVMSQCVLVSWPRFSLPLVLEWQHREYWKYTSWHSPHKCYYCYYLDFKTSIKTWLQLLISVKMKTLTVTTSCITCQPDNTEIWFFPNRPAQKQSGITGD